MMRALLIACLLLTRPAVAATHPDAIALTNPMVADISQNAIEIRVSFNGAQVLVFGARNAPGDLVIAVRGPAANITLRRKERIAGMWMHVEQHKYINVPLFYAITSSKPLKQIASTATLQSLGLGEQQITIASNDRIYPLFDAALSNNFHKRGWWQSPFAKITYFGESLFKAQLNLPDTLPGGVYTAEIYLFDRGELRSMQTIPITVYKTGLEEHIYESAQKNGLTYGLAAVLLALAGGWLAHRLFHRR